MQYEINILHVNVFSVHVYLQRGRLKFHNDNRDTDVCLFKIDLMDIARTPISVL